MRRSQRDLFSAGIGIVALIALAVGRPIPAPEAASDKPLLRLTYFPNITHAAALAGVDQGIFVRALPEFRVEERVVNAGPEAMEALLAGEVDVAYVGPSPAINTYLKTNGEALRIIAGASSGGAALVRRKGLPIRTVADLDGRRLAIPQIGGTQDISARTFLAKAGLRPRERGGTVEILPIKNPDILSLFKRGQLDAAWVPEPWVSRVIQEAGAELVLDERSLWPNETFTTTVVVVRQDFARKHPEVAEAFARANQSAVAFLNSDTARAKAAVNRQLKRLAGKELPARVIDSAWARVKFTTDPDPTSVQAFARAAFDAGYAKSAPPPLDDLFAETAR